MSGSSQADGMKVSFIIALRQILSTVLNTRVACIFIQKIPKTQPVPTPVTRRVHTSSKCNCAPLYLFTSCRALILLQRIVTVTNSSPLLSATGWNSSITHQAQLIILFCLEFPKSKTRLNKRIFNTWIHLNVSSSLVASFTRAPSPPPPSPPSTDELDWHWIYFTHWLNILHINECVQFIVISIVVCSIVLQCPMVGHLEWNA